MTIDCRCIEWHVTSLESAAYLGNTFSFPFSLPFSTCHPWLIKPFKVIIVMILKTIKGIEIWYSWSFFGDWTSWVPSVYTHIVNLHSKNWRENFNLKRVCGVITSSKKVNFTGSGVKIHSKRAILYSLMEWIICLFEVNFHWTSGGIHSYCEWFFCILCVDWTSLFLEDVDLVRE